MICLKTDYKQLCGCSGLVQMAIEFGVLGVAISSLSLREKVMGLDQIVIHLQQADQYFWIDFSCHKETYQPSGPLHLQNAFSDFFTVHLASRIEHLTRVINCNPALSQSVDCSLAKSLASRIHAMGHPPFLKQCSYQCRDDSQGRGYRADRSPIWRHFFLPHSTCTLAIGTPA